MHTRPYTVRFGLCIAGIILGGAILCDCLDRTFDPYFLTFWGGVGLTVCLSIVADGIYQHHAELIRAEANRLYAQELTNWERAQALERSATPTSAPPSPDTQAQAWRIALERFFRAGDAAGSFSIRSLSGVIGSDSWALLTDWFCSEQGGRVLRVAAGNAGTTWGYGWGLDRVLQLLATGKLPLPPGDAPEVEPYIANKTRQNATKRSPTVVEGVAKPAEKV